MNEVAKNLKKIRVSSGMTQEELAEKMFVTRQTISNWENGKSQPDVQTLTSLADSFGVEVSELIYGRKRPYIRFQKKYIVTACLSLAVVIAFFILEQTLRPHLVEHTVMFFNGFELIVYDFATRPIGFLSIGVFILSVLSFWVDTRLEKKIRIVILIIGIILFLLSFWLLTTILLVHTFPKLSPDIKMKSPFFYSEFLRMVLLLVTPLLAGSALFLGFNKK